LHPLPGITDGHADGSDLNGLKVQVAAARHTKCERCWHHLEDVGSHSEHPDLCGRCVVNISGEGESRRFV
jgi:isoleucyl-tRNA synthetase